MVFVFNGRDSRQAITEDVEKKNTYVKNGSRIAGSVKGDKLTLYLEDRFGKHSDTTTERFYGCFTSDGVKGSFRMANYLVVLLIVLFAVCVESIIVALLRGMSYGTVAPAVILASEVVYFFVHKRASKTSNEYITEYLSKF